jgi:hypothetical protein
MIVCSSSVICETVTVGRLHDLVRRGCLLGQHDLGLAVLPLADEELPLGPPGLVPAERAEDRLDLVVAQPVGELDLVGALDRADRLDRGLHHLRGGIGVGRVLGHLGAAVHLLVLGDELFVAGCGRVLRVADRVEDAFGGVLADALDELVAERGCARLEEHLRLEADLLQRAHEADAVGERRAVHHHVGVLRLDRVSDRVEVARVGRIGALLHGLDAGRLELRADALQDRDRERVVQRRICRRLGALVRGQVQDPVGPHVALLVGRRLLREEEVLVAALEDLRRAAGGLDVEHLVALGDGRRRDVQQRGERAGEEIHLVLADQRRVVGDDRVLVARVVAERELDLALEQAALLVRHRLPDLVALLGGLAGLGELAGQRQRRADLDRASAPGCSVAAVVVVGRATADRNRCRQNRKHRRESQPVAYHSTPPR